MFDIKNILLTTDFSELSLAASEQAIALAKKYDAVIHLLYVLEKTPPILAIRSLDLSEDRIREMIDADAEIRLRECTARLISDGVKVIPVIKKGLDYEEIIKYCGENNIDLVVIATHGRTGILHTLVGSVAEKVIRYSKCPVLVVKPAEY